MGRFLIPDGATRQLHYVVMPLCMITKEQQYPGEASYSSYQVLAVDLQHV